MRPLVVFILILIAVAAFVFTVTRSPSSVDEIAPEASAIGIETETPTTELTATERVPTEDRGEPEIEPDRGGDRDGRRVDVNAVTGGFENRLAGRVVNGDGDAVPAAKVTLSLQPMMGESLAELVFLPARVEESAGRPMYALTDDEGRYDFRSIPPHPAYYLLVVHEDYSRVQEPGVFVGEEGEFQGPEVLLQPGPILRGLVLDEDGVAIRGATVHTDSAYMLSTELVSPDRLSAVANEAGRYEIRNIPPGPRNVLARAPGYGVEVRHNIMFRGLEEEVVDIDFRLGEGLPLAGRVVGPDGLGIAGAQVLALHFGNNSSSRGQTTTDDRGTFRIEGLRNGPYMVRAEAVGYRHEIARGDRSKAGNLNVVVNMVLQARIRGTVLAQNGSPLSSFTCAVQYVDDSGSIYENTQVSQSFENVSDGSYEMGGLDPGKYVVQARAPDFAPTVSSPFTVTRDDQVVSGITVRLTKGGGITGVVKDLEGKAVEGAMITTFDNEHINNAFNDLLGNLLGSNVTKKRTRTGPGGRFELDLLTPALYQIHIEHPTFTKTIHKDLHVRGGELTDLGILTVQQGGSIRGIVRDEAGSALRRGHVILRGDDAVTSYSARTDNQGRYAFHHVRPGSYTLSASRSGPGSGGGDVFEVILDQKNSEVSISVFDGGDVTQHLNLGG